MIFTVMPDSAASLKSLGLTCFFACIEISDLNRKCDQKAPLFEEMSVSDMCAVRQKVGKSFMMSAKRWVSGKLYALGSNLKQCMVSLKRQMKAYMLDNWTNSI